MYSEKVYSVKRGMEETEFGSFDDRVDGGRGHQPFEAYWKCVSIGSYILQV